MGEPARGVLCVGNLVWDTLARPVGEPLGWNASRWVASIEQHLGGNGANTAYAAAKMGARARIVGAVGGDEMGRRVAEMLEGVGVDTRFVERVAGATAATVALVRADGARALLHAPGASEEAFREPLALSGEMVAGCGRLHVGNPFGVPGLRKTAPEILRRARAAGLETSLDAGWDARGEWMAVFGPCLEAAGTVVVNEDELRHLTGSEGRAGAEAMLKEGAGRVVVKRGARGCAVYEAGDEFEAAGFAVEAVDTTGAGDCFAGAFLAGLARGMGAREAARLANAAGALSVTVLGSVAGLRGYEETMAWMKNEAAG